MTKMRLVVAALCPVFAAECTDLEPVHPRIDDFRSQTSTPSSRDGGRTAADCPVRAAATNARSDLVSKQRVTE
jgi:hypothetical protein